MLLVPRLLLATLLYSPPPCRAQLELRVRSPLGHDIAAVLETPDSTARLPVVVLIAGAGPSDRDGHTHITSERHNDTFRALSRVLQERGFAVLRFDEVGTGASGGDYWKSATKRVLSEDVVALVTALRERREVDPDRIALVGHSEGGTIAGLVAQRVTVHAMVLLATPAWVGRRIIEYQDSVAQSGADVLPEPARSAERTRIANERRRVAAEREAAEPWYREFLDFDHSSAYRDLMVPTLIVHGEEDRWVSVAQAYAIADAMRARGNTRVRLDVYPELGHSLVTDQWARVVEPLSPRVQTTLIDWLAETLRAAPVSAVCRRS